MSNDLSSNNINLEMTELEEPRSPMERRLTVDVHDDIIDRALEMVDISSNIPDSVRSNIKKSLKLRINPEEIHFDDYEEMEPLEYSDNELEEDSCKLYKYKKVSYTQVDKSLNKGDDGGHRNFFYLSILNRLSGILFCRSLERIMANKPCNTCGYNYPIVCGWNKNNHNAVYK